MQTAWSARLLSLGLAFSLAAFTGCRREEAAGSAAPADSAAPTTLRVLGPGGGGGQFLPTVNPADRDHIFIRCDMTGAYVSHDGGQSWRQFQLRTVVSDFEFSPGEPDVIYAANSGLYRSEDRGDSWSLIYPRPEEVVSERMIGDHAEQSFETRDGMPDGDIEKVRVDPADPARLYLGLAAPFRWHPARGREFSADSCGLVVSLDRGGSWKLLARLPGRTVLAILPGSWDGRPDELTVVTERSLARVEISTGKVSPRPLPVEGVIHADGGHGQEAGTVIYLLAGLEQQGGKLRGGIYRSADGGKSWEQANQGLLEDFPATGALPSFRTFAVCESDPRVAYLSCDNYPATADSGKAERQYGIFKTEDGSSWRWVYRADNERQLTDNLDGGWMMENYGPEWGEYPLSLGVMATDPNTCWATDFGVSYRTIDGGVSWQQVCSRKVADQTWVSRGLDVTNNYGVHFDPFDPQHLFVSYTDVGAFQSFDGGESWVHAIAGVPRPWINTCYWAEFDPAVKGRAWAVWGNAHDLPRPKMFRAGNFNRYGGGVTVSDDAARTWRGSNAGMPDNTVCTHVLLDPDSPKDSRTLYVCGFGKGVFKSTDGGANWKLMNNGIGPNLNAYRITRLPDGSLFLLVARGLENRQVVDGALYLSRDGAESWTRVALPAGVNAPNDLVIDPQEPQRMYLSCWPWPTDRQEQHGGLLRSEDGGASWQRVFREDAHVYAAAVDPEHPATVFINSFDSAAFRSDDYGRTWQRLPGYRFKWGQRPVLDIHDPRMLYLTTFGGGLFHLPRTGAPGTPEDIVNAPDSWRWGGYTGEAL